MELAWVNKLVEDGQISKEAAEIIHKDCETLLANKEDFAKVSNEFLSNVLTGTVTTLAATGTIGAIIAGMNRLETIELDAKSKAVRNKIVNNPSLEPKIKEKAEARFNEIAKFAPSLASNEAVMSRLVMDKLHSGLNDGDVQRLVSIQSKFTPNPLQYSEMSHKFAEETNAGVALAEKYIQFEKEAFDFSAAMKSLGTIGTPIKNMLLTTVAPAMVIGSGIAGARWIKEKIDEKSLHNKLEATYEAILADSKDTPIGENPMAARKAFDTLKHFAPHVALEPNAAKGFMTKLISYNQAPQSTDIRELTEIEKNVRGTGHSSERSVYDLVGLPTMVGQTITDVSKRPRDEFTSAVNQKMYH